MDLINRTDVQALATSEAEGTHVSLFIPTHRFGDGVQADQLEWKNLVGEVDAILLEDMRRTEVEALLAPARELQNDAMAWQYMADGLAMFLRPGWHQTYRIPASLPKLATVGDHFVTGPLMRLLSGDEHFLLLAVSQSQVRLMDGSRHTVRQIELDDVPTALEDVLEIPEGRPNQIARPMSTGRGGRAVFYGHGAGEDTKDSDLRKFFRDVADGLVDVLHDQTAPLVLVGLEQNVSAYRQVDKYGHTLDRAVHRNPDDLSVEQLHDLAWPIVEERLREDRQQLIERFQQLHGTGQVSSDLAAISQVAEQGRVDTLFMKSDPWCWERVTDGGEAAVARLGKDERFVVCEQVDKAAADTLAYGGQVHATSRDIVADGEVAAILRF